MTEESIVQITLASTSTFLVTVVGACKIFLTNLGGLRTQISRLSDTITELDKNLAVQTTILTRIAREHDDRNKFNCRS